MAFQSSSSDPVDDNIATVSVTLPKSLFQAVEALAVEHDTTASALIASAVAAKIAAMRKEHLPERASRGNRNAFLDAMAKVPNTSADPEDRVIDGSK